MRAHRGFSALLTAAILVLGGAAAAHAQGTTSRVLGTVTDSSGGLIPGATVTLTNDATGVSFTAVTSATGTYVC